MKKTMIIVAVLLVVTGSAMAQQPGGNFPRRTVEERVKRVHDKLDSAFHLAAEKLQQTDEVFKEYYTAQDKMREELMSGGERPSREVIMAKMQELSDARDTKLKPILTEEQMKIWKEQIEPSMRPQRGGGRGGQ